VRRLDSRDTTISSLAGCSLCLISLPPPNVLVYFSTVPRSVSTLFLFSPTHISPRDCVVRNFFPAPSNRDFRRPEFSLSRVTFFVLSSLCPRKFSSTPVVFEKHRHAFLLLSFSFPAVRPLLTMRVFPDPSEIRVFLTHPPLLPPGPPVRARFRLTVLLDLFPDTAHWRSNRSENIERAARCQPQHCSRLPDFQTENRPWPKAFSFVLRRSSSQRRRLSYSYSVRVPLTPASSRFFRSGVLLLLAHFPQSSSISDHVGLHMRHSPIRFTSFCFRARVVW